MITQLALKTPRLGITDLFHDAVQRRGATAKLFLLLFGTPHLGTFANGFYLRRALKKRRYVSILDAGCGDGTFCFYAARRYPAAKVTGVDIGEQGMHGEEDTLEVGQRVLKSLQLRNLEFRKKDLRDLGFRDKFDFVYSFDVLEHIAENKQVLENIYRALQPGGDFLIRIPTEVQKRILPEKFTAEHAKWAKIEHLGQHYVMDTLVADMKAIGFEIQQQAYTMGFFGRLSFELAEAAKFYKAPAPVLFALTPALKVLRYLDTVTPVKDGDGLLVFARKPRGKR